MGAAATLMLAPADGAASPEPSEHEAATDIEAMLWSMRLHNLRRYMHHRFWEDETRDALYADRVEPGLKLESVSAHSWHVADGVLLLSEHFPQVNRGRCLELATLHDKLELITGDYNPVGRDGLGTYTHAFNHAASLKKLHHEHQAAELYLNKLRPAARPYQRQLLEECWSGTSIESRFVKAVDKLQSFLFVHVKKNGLMHDRHIVFTLRYAAKTHRYFPALKAHHDYVRSCFLDTIAARRRSRREELEQILFGQFELDLE